MWATEAASEFTLSDDQFEYLASILDLQTWPAVLAVESRHEYVTERLRARGVAANELGAAGWAAPCPDSAAGVYVCEPLAEALSTLAAPEVIIEMRCHRVDSTQRTCLARRGDHHVSATRADGGLTIRDVAVSSDLEVGSVVARWLTPAEAARTASVSVPAAQLQQRLDSVQSAAELADALHAAGVAADDAATYAVALDTCCGHTEIVAIECAPGRMHRSAGAVAVYDTAQGRIVAGPSMSPDGQVWSTLSPGTGHRISQAVTLLMETLPARRWLP